MQRSAGETLADILIRYLTDLAKAADFYANLAGRTQCNALDVIMAMEDVGTSPTSAAENNRPLSSSKALQEVMHPHTYKSTPVRNERKSDPRLDKLELARQRRKAERSLVSLHSRLSSTGAATPKLTLLPEPHVVSAPGENAIPAALAAIRASVGISPSLASSAGVPSRQQWPPSSEQEAILSKLEAEELTKRENHKKQMVKYLCPSVLEAFAPAIEAARHGKDSMDGGEGAHILPEAKDRRPVHLSFDWGKKAREKALAVQLSMGVHNRSPGKEKVKVTSQGSDEEKDDKKKRAEQILAQAMEAMEGADDVTQA
ncbi:hypothetical protein R1sor_008113 [Riccia sorocarpa]|uniref:Transcription initiation factor TFIID subunit 8 n=1 Tax=Riccia sorocarpa TaxID=122646 RepID=A0ABD3HVA5_9MARC